MQDPKVLSRMKSEIKRIAKKQEQSLLNEASKKQEAFDCMMQDIASKNASEHYDKTLSMYKKDALVALIDKKNKVQKELIDYRNDLSASVFDEALSRLRTFCVSSDYQAWLCSKIETCMLDSFSAPVLFVNEASVELLGSLKEQFKEIIVEDMLGGFKIEDTLQHVVIDYRLEVLLEEQKEWFTMHSKLVVK